jgi:hypothetical protein
MSSAVTTANKGASILVTDRGKIRIIDDLTWLPSQW